MCSLFDFNLSSEEIDILLLECNQEIQKKETELNSLIIKRDSIRRRIREWKNEKEVLEILKSGSSFTEFLAKVPRNTLNSIRKRYRKNIDKTSP